MASIKQIKTWADEARIEFYQKYDSKEKVQHYIERKMENKFNKLILSWLGFSNSYGDGWEVDHCNGRAGESEAGDQFRAMARKGVDSFFNDLKDQIDDVEIDNHLIASCKEEYYGNLKRELKSLVTGLAKRDAKQLFDQHIDAIVHSATSKEKNTAVNALQAALEQLPTWENKARAILQEQINELS